MSTTCRWAPAIARAPRPSSASCAAAGDAGVKDLTIFSFSTENWSRPDSEVGELMGLFSELIDREVPELNEEGVQIRFIGRIGDLDAELRARIAAAEQLTAGNTRLRLFVAMNYGSRREIVDAARRFVVECGPEAGEAEFAQFLYAPGPARPGAGDPHQRRAAPVQLPAVAVRVRRAALLAAALAGFLPRGPRPRDRGVRAAPPPIRWSLSASPRRP